MKSRILWENLTGKNKQVIVGQAIKICNTHLSPSCVDYQASGRLKIWDQFIDFSQSCFQTLISVHLLRGLVPPHLSGEPGMDDGENTRMIFFHKAKDRYLFWRRRIRSLFILFLYLHVFVREL